MKLLLSLLTFFSTTVFSSEAFLPKAIYKLDSRFTHHIIVVEKSTHSLFIYKNDNGKPKLLKSFKIATGKITGDKYRQGDKKTPEGIYHILGFHPSKDLVKKYGKHGLIYGAGAFPLNFPNPIDRKAEKTGGGIWLHSTDNDARVSKGLDSRGCVVATDADLKEISNYIQLKNTQVVITQIHNFQDQSSWKNSRKKILATIETWANAWKEKSFKTYINSYSVEHFNDRRKGNFYSYKRYKKAVFARKDKPQINFNNISILRSNNYAVVTMKQDYSSRSIKDSGKKVLYLQLDKNYDWKIVAELWSKLPADSGNSPFNPSQRFFLNQEVAHDTKSI